MRWCKCSPTQRGPTHRRGGGGGSFCKTLVLRHPDTPFDKVKAGLHWFCKMSRQMLPLLFTLQ